ncbi:hypothetical protein [Natronospora cellulosivora (SeqCode)]
MGCDKELVTYIGIELENKASVSLEIDVAFEIFFLALILDLITCGWDSDDNSKISDEELRKELKRKRDMIDALLDNLD